MCMACGSRDALQCSHYFGRRIMALRFSPENCVSLCDRCHKAWEKDKKGPYRQFMILRMGLVRFEGMEAIAHRCIEKKREAIERCRRFLEGGGTE